MRRPWGEMSTAAAIIALAVYLAHVALEFPAGGEIFPLFALCGMVLFAAVNLVRAAVTRDVAPRTAALISVAFDRLKPWYLCLLVMVYVWAMFELGYFVSSLLFLITATLLVGIRRYRIIVRTAVFLFPAIYAFFVLFLHANLPTGILY